TTTDLKELGFSAPVDIQPAELFSMDAIMSIKGFLILALGGLMVGFGSRYAGGCTSGHAISGLSDLQFPSFIAVIGFFMGGLLMTHLLFPIIF
ncbi:MAG: YeeE/YedE thiosulfate transporter family protein, partial [Saprospiraceae bacterium]